MTASGDFNNAKRWSVNEHQISRKKPLILNCSQPISQQLTDSTVFSTVQKTSKNKIHLRIKYLETNQHTCALCRTHVVGCQVTPLPQPGQAEACPVASPSAASPWLRLALCRLENTLLVATFLFALTSKFLPLDDRSNFEVSWTRVALLRAVFSGYRY